MGWVLIAGLFLPCIGRAHTLGLSTADLAVEADGRVAARFTFASAELRGERPGGSAGRGAVEGPLRDEDLRALVLDGTDVTADGARCDPSYGGSASPDGDGILVEATYACPPGAAAIGVTLYYLSALPPGHREIARIVGPPGSHAHAEAVLTGDRRALVLELRDAVGSDASDPTRARRATEFFGVAAVFASLTLWVFLRRRRSRGR
jgi:hypothetical protein